jgi:hypothetical protein
MIGVPRAAAQEDIDSLHELLLAYDVALNQAVNRGEAGIATAADTAAEEHWHDPGKAASPGRFMAEEHPGSGRYADRR